MTRQENHFFSSFLSFACLISESSLLGVKRLEAKGREVVLIFDGILEYAIRTVISADIFITFTLCAFRFSVASCFDSFVSWQRVQFLPIFFWLCHCSKRSSLTSFLKLITTLNMRMQSFWLNFLAFFIAGTIWCEKMFDYAKEPYNNWTLWLKKYPTRSMFECSQKPNIQHKPPHSQNRKVQFECGACGLWDGRYITSTRFWNLLRLLQSFLFLFDTCATTKVWVEGKGGRRRDGKEFEKKAAWMLEKVKSERLKKRINTTHNNIHIHIHIHMKL